MSTKTGKHLEAREQKGTDVSTPKKQLGKETVPVWTDEALSPEQPPPHPKAILVAEIDFDNDTSRMRWEAPCETLPRLKRIRAEQRREILKDLARAFPSIKEKAFASALQFFADNNLKTPFHFDVIVRKGNVKRPTDRFTVPAVAKYTEFCPEGQFQLLARGTYRRKATIPTQYVFEYTMKGPKAQGGGKVGSNGKIVRL